MEEETKKYIAYAAIGLAALVGFKLLFGSRKVPVTHEYSSPKPDSLPQYDENGTYWVESPWEAVDIQVAQKGTAGEKPVTIFELVDQFLQADPDAIYLNQQIKDASGQFQWRRLTRRQFVTDIKRAARALIKLGLEPWHAVNIIGFNCPEWFIADLAAIYAGGLACGVYTTNSPGECLHVANHSKADIVILENAKQLAKYIEIEEQLESVKAIVIWGEPVPAEAAKMNIQVLSWQDFLAMGDDMSPQEEMENRMSRIEPGNCCTLIFTSGTTGKSKAVMISHDNIIFNVRQLLNETFPQVNFGEEHAVVSYLPLSHIAAQFVDIHAAFVIAAFHHGTGSVFFARPDALKGSLVETLQAARPTIFMGVPRVWEKIMEKMLAQGKKGGAVTKMIGDWAKSRGLQAGEALQCGGHREMPFGHSLASRVHGAVKGRLGLDRCKIFVSAAAPLPVNVADYFFSLGMPLLECYGMSECTGAHTVGRDFWYRRGTVGATLNCCETKIDHDPGRDRPGEGEICMRGRHVMMGYMYQAEKTRETIAPGGWLHSGDIGQLDQYGNLKITGRAKELIITQGGENVAPVPIEHYIKERLPGVSQLILIGDQRKYLTMLVTLQCKPDPDQEFAFLDELDGPALDVNPDVKTVTQAQNDPVWREYIQRGIDEYNGDQSACVSRAQRVQKFVILPEDLSVPANTLTSTLKIKRPRVYARYPDYIENMYK